MSQWDPFRDLMTIQDQMNRLFQDTMTRQRGPTALESGQWAPAVDIVEESERILLRADLPGVEQSSIELRVEDNVLTLKGERPLPPDVTPESVHRSERPHGTFLRSFSLPGNIDVSGIRAVQRNGVLDVTLPKKQETKARAIRVDVK